MEIAFNTMSEVKRFSFTREYDIEEDDNGEYVLHGDYKDLMFSFDQLEKQNIDLYHRLCALEDAIASKMKWSPNMENKFIDFTLNQRIIYKGQMPADDILIEAYANSRGRQK